MSAAGVITEFLASVGFQADEKSLKSALLKVAGFGAAVQMMAVGIYAGLIRVASGEAEMARQAERLGTTSDKIQELGYIAESSGVKIDVVTKSLEAMVSKNPRIRDAAAAMELAGEKMKRMNEAQRRAYAARMGIDPSLIPALISDTEQLKGEFRAMYDVAKIDAKEAGEASKGFMSEIGKLNTMVGLLGKSVALTFIVRIRQDVEALRRAIMENFDKIKRVLEAVIAVVLRIAGVISAFAHRVIKWITGVVEWFDRLDDGQKKLVVGATLLLAAWRLLNAGFLATPLGMLIMGLMAIVALVDDYLTYMEGGESYFDWGPWVDDIEAVLEALKPILGVIMGIGEGILAALGPALKNTIATIGRVINVFKLWGQYIKALFSGDFGEAADLAIKIFEGFYDIIVGIFSNMVETIKAFFAAMWPSVQENFPDFAAWAEGAAAAVMNFLAPAIDWVKEKLGMLADLAIKIFEGFYDIIVGIFSNMVETIKAFFAAMWPSVQENFPDFAAWAEGAAAAVMNFLAPAIDWVKEKLGMLADLLPDWAKKALGIGTERKRDDPKSGPSDEVKAARKAARSDNKPDVTDAPKTGEPRENAAPLHNAVLASQATQNVSLTPGPAEAASMTTNNNTDVKLESKTEINVYSSDPVAAGNQAAAQQDRVHADLVRNTQTRMK